MDLTKMDESILKKELFSYLYERKLMSLATIHPDGNPAICTVFYAIDENLNFYFVSEPESTHLKNIAANPSVAIAVSDSNQSVKDQKVGVQLEGIAEKITGLEALSHAIDLWNAANPGISSIINFGNLAKKAIESEVFRVQPKAIKFFNEKIFGEEGVMTLSFIKNNSQTE